jgi:carboxyl-terminal processing protease
MSNNFSSRTIFLPLILGAVLAAGIFLGTKMVTVPATEGYNKINDVLSYVQEAYVDTINRSQLSDKTIEKMLEQLDPHSAYIPAEELSAANEPLEGNFEGIGIEFHIQQDTIMVVSAISGGPSDVLGIQPGDRIIKVDDKTVAGKGITNEQVFKMLRGKGGTHVKVSIKRNDNPKLIDFDITRGKIPIYSIDVAYMADAKTGYIKISRFAEPTYDEFVSALQKLEQQGMKQMILDLRGNPGGYLNAATSVADEMIDGTRLLVYTKGKARPRTDYKSGKKGLFEKGKIVVLIDEGSASASEIVAGALQDWDRATIMGRRSFGKGLVQEQSAFPDGSAMRLTVARYYTPTGRCIQKPYTNGVEAYNDELLQRIKHGELFSADSVKLTDTVQYKTPSGKIVYGGGGIMPDIFVPVDSSFDSDYLNSVLAAGLVNQFAYDYVDLHRSDLKQYRDKDDFKKRFVVNGILQNFIEYAEKKGVKPNAEQIRHSASLIEVQLKAYIARLLWQNDGMYPILQEADVTFQKALRYINQ